MHEAKKRITKHDIASVYEFGFTLKNPLSEQVALHRFNVITICKRSYGKVMFLQVSVILFAGGSGIPACIAGLQAHTQGGKLRGLVWGGSPGPHPGGSWGVWPGGFPGLHRWVSRPRPRGVSSSSRAAGGTHPTGMHACLNGTSKMFWIQKKSRSRSRKSFWMNVRGSN